VQHPCAGIVSPRFIHLLGIEDFARHAGHGDILAEQIHHPMGTVSRGGGIRTHDLFVPNDPTSGFGDDDGAGNA